MINQHLACHFFKNRLVDQFIAAQRGFLLPHNANRVLPSKQAHKRSLSPMDPRFSGQLPSELIGRHNGLHPICEMPGMPLMITLMGTGQAVIHHGLHDRQNVVHASRRQLQLGTPVVLKSPLIWHLTPRLVLAGRCWPNDR